LGRDFGLSLFFYFFLKKVLDILCIMSYGVYVVERKGNVMNYLVKDAATGRVLAGLFEALETEQEAQGAAAYFVEKGFVEATIIEEYEVE